MTLEQQILWLLITSVYGYLTYQAGKRQGIVTGISTFLHHLESTKVVKVIRDIDGDISDVVRADKDANL